MAGRTPNWRSREARFRSNGVQYTGKEWYWSHVQEEEVPTQIGDTSVVHAMVSATENRYRIHYKNNNQVPPFNGLSVEYVENRVATFIGLHKVMPKIVKDLATDVIRAEGILRDEDYCLPGGRRGEENWKRLNLIPADAPRFPTERDEWVNIQDISDKTPTEKRRYLSNLIKEGPVYVDFFPPNGYERNDGFPHGFNAPPPDYKEEELNKVQVHSVMLIGYGSYKDKDDQQVFYFLYRNTFSPSWGDRGFGRILADEMNGIQSIWIPRVPDSAPVGLSASHASTSRPARR